MTEETRLCVDWNTITTVMTKKYCSEIFKDLWNFCTLFLTPILPPPSSFKLPFGICVIRFPKPWKVSWFIERRRKKQNLSSFSLFFHSSCQTSIFTRPNHLYKFLHFRSFLIIIRLLNIKEVRGLCMKIVLLLRFLFLSSKSFHSKKYKKRTNKQKRDSQENVKKTSPIFL